MTNKEAIKILDNLKPGDYSNPYEKGEAIVMAISALQEQEAKAQLSAEGTTSDLISRQDAIDVCDNAIDLWHGQLGEGIVIAVKKKIEELPSAQPEPCEFCKHNNIADDKACLMCSAERRTDA